MEPDDAAVIARQLDMLRRDGSVTARFGSAEEAAAWRATMRRACRTAGLRIRTTAADADGHWTAWAAHLDHVTTEADERATRRALEAAYNGELACEEQRKLLRIVRDDDTCE